MRVACVGGGPGGLFFAILAAQLPQVEAVTVFERSPEGVTYGWGVVFWDDLLEAITGHDAPTGAAIGDSAFAWHDQIISVERDEPANLGGHGYAMGRRALRGLLTRRARDLGVELRFGEAVDDPATLTGYDVVVAADGVNSALRSADPAFGTTVTQGRNKYIWLGTSKVFGSFTFPFVRVDGEWLWAHAYGYDQRGSTFVVETSAASWRRLGFDALDPDATLRTLETIFAAQLDGHGLTSSSPPPSPGRDTAPWLEFRTVRNARWYHGNVVLLGDAAHTTHFTIGSGTRLALLDAMALATQLGAHDRVPQALAAYERQRVAELAPVAAEADDSAAWFEELDRYIGHGSREFAQLLVERRRLLARRLPGAYLGLRRARKAAAASALARPARRIVRRIRRPAG